MVFGFTVPDGVVLIGADKIPPVAVVVDPGDGPAPIGVIPLKLGVPVITVVVV